MYVLGGICFVFFYIQGESMGWQEPVWKQTLRCTVFVTAGEFITGIIVNKWLHYSVWDYSQMPLQVFGQICVPFMIIFSGLSVLGIFLSGYLAFYLYKEVKPSYHILYLNEHKLNFCIQLYKNVLTCKNPTANI